MKYIKWKSMVITCLVCLLPILLGISLWDELPDSIAIHFNFHNEPDNFAPKGFVVFGLPILMMLMQMFCCIVTDTNSHKYGTQKKFERVVKWILPCVTLVLQIATLGYSLGWSIDIRRVAVLLVCTLFIAIGNYLPKLDYIKNYRVDIEKARKINRFLGYELVIMGLLGLVTLFLPPITSVIWLILLIPYTIISLLYGIKVERSE